MGAEEHFGRFAKIIQVALTLRARRSCMHVRSSRLPLEGLKEQQLVGTVYRSTESSATSFRVPPTHAPPASLVGQAAANDPYTI